jgi:hypothetical protein
MARIRPGRRALMPSKVTKRRSLRVDSATVIADGSPGRRTLRAVTPSVRRSRADSPLSPLTAAHRSPRRAAATAVMIAPPPGDRRNACVFSSCPASGSRLSP